MRRIAGLFSDVTAVVASKSGSVQGYATASWISCGNVFSVDIRTMLHQNACYVDAVSTSRKS